MNIGHCLHEISKNRTDFSPAKVASGGHTMRDTQARS